ncbi:GNAT family N-acetyltransferase [Nocardiopsis valliformis]|uniref:GNAT family N-acetyltransferase n=1 Tax=Nocardiopsis valliformis TaxID=239974 RepID=UPI000349AAF1|nr:GNAT family N-acetyltransferase [Nocardiopsis valliformis]
MSQAEQPEQAAPAPEGFAERGWVLRAGGKDDFRAVVEVVGEALVVTDDRQTSFERLTPILAEDGFERLLLVAETDWPGQVTGAEDERVIGGERVIGSVNAFSFEMTVPGGTQAAAGVTGVGVWPTRRRQGILTALMRRQLSDIHRRGEKIAILWASEGTIYGRYGYAPAIDEYGTTLEGTHARLRPDAPRDPALFVELLRASRVRADLERVFATVAAEQSGRLQRSPAFWDRTLRDTPESRDGKSYLKAAVAYGPDGPVGYALYRTLNKWADANPASEVHVEEMVAAAPEARTALYEHLFSRDLVTRLVFEATAEDDPLQYLIADPHRLVTKYDDSLWLRLVDVPGALAERSYAAPVEVVIEVADRHALWNEGRWRLRADGSGATCEATSEAADVSLDVSHLGAVYLGANTLTGFLRNGLLIEHTPGAVAALDTALFRPEAPFCGQGF